MVLASVPCVTYLDLTRLRLLGVLEKSFVGFKQLFSPATSRADSSSFCRRLKQMQVLVFGGGKLPKHGPKNNLLADVP